MLTPIRDSSPSVAGTVAWCDVGAAGLAVNLRAHVAAEAVETLQGQRVWVTAHVDDRLIAFQAVAQRTAGGALDLNGVNAPVQEHRRAQLRAATRLAAHLRVTDGAAPSNGVNGVSSSGAINAATVDLSRGGCRVQLPDAGSGAGVLPPVGAHVDIVLDLAGKPAEVASRVLRVDPGAGQAVLQFTAVAPEDAERIERHVLSLIL